MPADIGLTVGRRVLLLAEGSVWSGAARVAAANLGATEVVEAQSPGDAIQLLTHPGTPFSHLLLEPGAAGERIVDLVGLTAGEPGAATALVWLGSAPADPMRGPPVATSIGELVDLLAARVPTAAHPALGSRELAAAIAHGRIANHYQPIVSFAPDGRLAFEALARWRHPQHGTLPPDAFIALAERAGLGGFLTEDVTIRALSDIAALPAEVLQPQIGINFPLDVLLVRETIDRLDAARKVTGLPAERVIVELTESRPVDDVSALRQAAERLRQNGYQLAVDDVGPSVANHRRLFDLPFTSMKLDKDLVRQSATRPQARQFVERAIADGKARGLTVVAEGVETPEIWHAMQAAGADMAQGFLIGRAMPAGALPAWAEGWHRQRRFP